MGTGWPLVGERTEFHFYYGRDVGTRGNGLRIGEVEFRGVVLGVEFVGEPSCSLR